MAATLTPTISFESAPTIEEILRECDTAWEYARMLRGQHASLTDETSSQESRDNIDDDIYVELSRAHSSMNQTYPVILAAMAAGHYSRRAAKKFFLYVRDHPWKSEEEFLDTQAVYSSCLYRDTHKHVDSRAVATVRGQTREVLQETQAEMKRRIERLQKIADATNKRRAGARANEFARRLTDPITQQVLLHGRVFPTVISFEDE